MKRKISSGIFIALICVFAIAAQNAEPPEKAFLSNAYGEFSVESVRTMFDNFFLQIIQRENSKGIVVIYGPVKELADRKKVMSDHVRMRKINPAQIEYRFVGGSMEPRTDLWVVPSGAEPPKTDRKKYIAFEFGRTNKKDMQRYMDEFYNAVINDQYSQAYIINYGTPKQIAQRERMIQNSIRIVPFDAPRTVFVNGGSSNNGVRTVMWVVPEGAEPPKP